jgi:hypothetical protein
MFFFFRSRYAPLVRATVGVVLVVVGLVLGPKIPVIIGLALIIWGIVSGVGQLRRRRFYSDRDGDRAQ